MPGTILSAKDTEAYILPVVKQTRNTYINKITANNSHGKNKTG